MVCEHPNSVAKDSSPRERARRVDGNHRNRLAVSAQLGDESVDEGTLPCPGRSSDAYFPTARGPIEQRSQQGSRFWATVFDFGEDARKPASVACTNTRRPVFDRPRLAQLIMRPQAELQTFRPLSSTSEAAYSMTGPKFLDTREASRRRSWLTWRSRSSPLREGSQES